MAALDAGLAGLHAVLQVKSRVAGTLAGRHLRQKALGGGQGQFGVDGVVFADRLVGLEPDARNFGDKDQLVGLQRNRHAGRHFFHGQVEGLAGRRKTERRDQHHRAKIQRVRNGRYIDFAHQPRMLKIHAIDNAHGARGNKVAGNDADGRASHRRVGQTLAEGGFNFIAQLACSLLRAVECHAVGDAHAVGILRFVALGAQLLVDLGPKAMHQHHFHAHALDHGQVLRKVRQLAGGNGFTADRDHKRLVAKLVDVGCHRAEPGDKGEIEDRGHGALSGGARSAEGKCTSPRSEPDRFPGRTKK